MAESLVTQAEIRQAQKLYSQSEALYARCVAIQEKSVGPHHPMVAHTLRKWAGLLRQCHRKEEAIRLETRAESILALPRKEAGLSDSVSYN